MERVDGLNIIIVGTDRASALPSGEEVHEEFGAPLRVVRAARVMAKAGKKAAEEARNTRAAAILRVQIKPGVFY